jgi:hypothetical protein
MTVDSHKERTPLSTSEQPLECKQESDSKYHGAVFYFQSSNSQAEIATYL